MKRSLTFALLTSLAALSSAQSRSAFAYAAAGNQGYSSGLFAFEANASAGPAISVHPNKTWTGMDDLGNEQTMTFQGAASGSSDYGRLRTSVDASIKNTFYNSGNDPYWDGTTENPDGVADTFLLAGIAGFTDVLAFGGAIQANYSAQYVFYIDGTAAGEGVSANLRVTIANNATEHHDVDLTSGIVGEYWATQKYPVGSLLNQTANVQFTTRFDASVYDYAVPDGSDIAGSALFSSTITLSRIDIYDGERLVGGVTVNGASGTVYPTPEPASFAAVGLGVLAVLRRRRLSKGR